MVCITWYRFWRRIGRNVSQRSAMTSGVMLGLLCFCLLSSLHVTLYVIDSLQKQDMTSHTMPDLHQSDINLDLSHLGQGDSNYKGQHQPESYIAIAGRGRRVRDLAEEPRDPHGILGEITYHQVADKEPLVSRLATMRRHMLAPGVDRPPDAKYNVNVTLSDVIPINRPLPDERAARCRVLQYDVTRLGQASVIIPFYNEALSLLLRCLHSILRRTPPEVLREIIVIDDCSSNTNLAEELTEYTNLLPKVRLLRNTERQGLIRTRMRGADNATGDVLVFLDAHTEANQVWLEPLMESLMLNPQSVVQPFVDGINPDTIKYTRPPTIYKGAFTWDLRYVWLRLADHHQAYVEQHAPAFFSPTLVGCAMAINRDYFYHIGGFDREQLIWGGENIELAFRTWMCGGQVMTIPCSRLGHVFRSVPYKWETDWMRIWQKNLMRVAEVWMDEYKSYFYAATSVFESRNTSFTQEEQASLEKRKQLKKQLNCKGFRWYLNWVIPELPVPPHDSAYYGEVQCKATGHCWRVRDDDLLEIATNCFEHKIIPQNTFSLSRDGRLTYRDLCVTFMFPKPFLKVQRCTEPYDPDKGQWKVKYSAKEHYWGRITVSMRIKGEINTWCIGQVRSALDPYKGHMMPQTFSCDDKSEFIIWKFTHQFESLRH